MTIRLSDTARSAAATGIRDTLDAGSGAAYLELRTGSQPASVATTATGTLLATVTLADPSGTVATGVLTFAGLPKTDTSADATGTAGWFRMFDSTGAAHVDGSAGASGSGADLIVDNPSLVTGQTFSLAAPSTITMPAG